VKLVKQVMGLFMLAAGAYFLGTGLAGMLAKPPDPPTQAYWWFVAGFIGAAGVWLFWRTFQIATRNLSPHRVLRPGVDDFIGRVGNRTTLHSKQPIHWVLFHPRPIYCCAASGEVLVLEFTAAWCLNCHALEQAVLHDPRVVALLNSHNVIPIKVDLTGNNPAGNRRLIEAGRRTIPYLVIYSPDGNEIFSSDAYTADQILGAINKASP